MDERSHQVARWQDPLHDDQQVRVDLKQVVAYVEEHNSKKCLKQSPALSAAAAQSVSGMPVPQVAPYY